MWIICTCSWLLPIYVNIASLMCSFCWDLTLQCPVWHIPEYLLQQCHRWRHQLQAVDSADVWTDRLTMLWENCVILINSLICILGVTWMYQYSRQMCEYNELWTSFHCLYQHCCKQWHRFYHAAPAANVQRLLLFKFIAVLQTVNFYNTAGDSMVAWDVFTWYKNLKC